jgi:hypothetical protein
MDSGSSDPESACFEAETPVDPRAPRQTGIESTGQGKDVDMKTQIAQRIGIPFVLLVIAAAYFLEAGHGKAQDMLLIRPVFYLMVLLFCINAITDLRDILRQKEKAGGQRRDDASLKAIMPFAGLAILFVAILPYAGFPLASLVFLFAVLFLFKVDNKAVLYLMPVGISIGLYLLFEKVFGVELPVGFLGF